LTGLCTELQRVGDTRNNLRELIEVGLVPRLGRPPEVHENDCSGADGLLSTICDAGGGGGHDRRRHVPGASRSGAGAGRVALRDSDQNRLGRRSRPVDIGGARERVQDGAPRLAQGAAAHRDFGRRHDVGKRLVQDEAVHSAHFLRIVRHGRRIGPAAHLPLRYPSTNQSQREGPIRTGNFLDFGCKQ
jgi:hypothetical protein